MHILAMTMSHLEYKVFRDHFLPLPSFTLMMIRALLEEKNNKSTDWEYRKLNVPILSYLNDL